MDTLYVETIRIVARIAAVFCTTVAAGLLLNGDYYKRELEKLLDNFGIIFIDGFLSLAVGCTLIYYHNVWVMDWPLLITLAGWGGLIQGIIAVAFPNLLKHLKPLFQIDNIEKAFAFLLLVMAALFAYLGFGF